MINGSSDTLPAPLVDAGVDLKDFPFTPLYRARLFGSGFHAEASDSEWRAGVTLWLKSWDQSPAGSLPNNEVALCRLAELGKDLKTWRKLSAGALHGWVLCSDGRLYHPVVAEGINDAWQRKQAQRDRTKAAREALAAKRPTPPPNGHDTHAVTEQATDAAATAATANATPPVANSKRQGQRRDKDLTLPSSPEHNPPPAREAQPLLEPLKPPNGDGEEWRFKKFGSGVPLARSARSAPDGALTTADKRNLLQQKLICFCKATFAEPQLSLAVTGLCGGDPEHTDLWWLNRLDKLMRLQKWDYTQQWKQAA